MLAATDWPLMARVHVWIPEWKEAVRERDLGTYDWTADREMNPE